MSRTYKDMPERVRLNRHRDKLLSKYVHERHMCGKPGPDGDQLVCVLDKSGRGPIDVDAYCQYVFSAGFYYSKPDYRGAVRDQVNKPLRMHERTFMINAIKDHRAGSDNPGGDRDACIPRPAQNGPLNGGYWH